MEQISRHEPDRILSGITEKIVRQKFEQYLERIPEGAPSRIWHIFSVIVEILLKDSPVVFF